MTSTIFFLLLLLAKPQPQRRLFLLHTKTLLYWMGEVLMFSWRRTVPGQPCHLSVYKIRLAPVICACFRLCGRRPIECPLHHWLQSVLTALPRLPDALACLIWRDSVWQLESAQRDFMGATIVLPLRANVLLSTSRHCALNAFVPGRSESHHGVQKSRQSTSRQSLVVASCP